MTRIVLHNHIGTRDAAGYNAKRVGEEYVRESSLSELKSEIRNWPSGEQDRALAAYKAARKSLMKDSVSELIDHVRGGIKESTGDGYIARNTRADEFRVFREGDPVAISGPLTREQAAALVRQKTEEMVRSTGKQFGQKIGGREAKVISALLRGRHGDSAATERANYISKRQMRIKGWKKELGGKNDKDLREFIAEAEEEIKRELGRGNKDTVADVLRMVTGDAGQPYGSAMQELKAAGCDVEVESDGPKIFLKIIKKNGRLMFIQIKEGGVSPSEVWSAKS
jgi:hypothetical protein